MTNENLIQGPVDKISLLRRERDFLLLDMPPVETRRSHQAPVSIAILLGVLVVVTAGCTSRRRCSSARC